MQSIIYNNNLYSIERFVKQYRADRAFPGQVASLINKWISGQKYFFLTTSGSTGKIKRHRFNAEQIKYSAWQTIKFFRLDSSDSLLCCLPVNKVAGFMMVIRALELNSDLIVVNPSQNPIINLNTDTKISFAAFVPNQFDEILNKTPEKLNILKDARAVILGGMAVNKEIIEKINKLVFPVYETYGMTETLSHIAVKKLNGDDKLSFFKQLKGTEIKTDDDERLMIRNKITNYKWLKTNDIVCLLAKDAFEVKGRIDNVINSGGIKIFPEIIEIKIADLIAEFFNTKRFFITGIENNKFGHIPVLVMERINSNSVNFEAFYDKLKKVLNNYEIPWRVYHVEQLAETETLKINRNQSVEISIKPENLIYERKR